MPGPELAARIKRPYRMFVIVVLVAMLAALLVFVWHSRKAGPVFNDNENYRQPGQGIHQKLKDF